RSKVPPLAVRQPFRNTVFSGEAHSIQVKLISLKRGNWAWAQAGAVGCNLAIVAAWSPEWSIRGIVEVGEEVRLGSIGFIGMRNSVPTQSKVKGQAVSGAPVVLEISIR